MICSPLIHSIVSNDSLYVDAFYSIWWFALHWYILEYPMICSSLIYSIVSNDSLLIHSTVSNDSVSGQWRPWSVYRCTDWSEPSLSAFARRHLLEWHGPYVFLCFHLNLYCVIYIRITSVRQFCWVSNLYVYVLTEQLDQTVFASRLTKALQYVKLNWDQHLLQDCMCAQQRFRSACTSIQPDNSLCRALCW